MYQNAGMYAEPKTKRVAKLLRVSDKIQLEDNDIPMQRQACDDFIDRTPEWVATTEYIEKGVSGFKKKSADRDVVQQVILGASRGEFDVLLVFMFDRLGRRDDDTPFVIQTIASYGVEVWSVKEGQQRFDNHTDRLINYLRSWQSMGESIKTSIRVTEDMSQMAKAGLYTGGTPPFGYELQTTGEYNKKGKELLALAVNKEEAAVVYAVFQMAYKLGYGITRLVKGLNNNRSLNVTYRQGRPFNKSNVKYILKNPIYKGYPAWGKSSCKSGSQHKQDKSKWVTAEKKVEHLAIIEEAVFDKVQEMMASRLRRNPDVPTPPTKSPLLLTGFIFCCDCGSPLSTSYVVKSYSRKDGSSKDYRAAKYRCYKKNHTGGSGCNGQTTYAAEKIENLVIDHVYDYLDKLPARDFAKDATSFSGKRVSDKQKELEKAKRDIEGVISELEALYLEIPKAILKKCDYNHAALNMAIEIKIKEQTWLEERIKELESAIKIEKTSYDSLEDLQEVIPFWKEEFEKGSLERKKMLLSQVISRITVSREGLVIDMKIEQFF